MIKILTLLGNNYGGCLQSVAMQELVKKYDDVETINYLEYLKGKKNFKDYIKSIVYLNRNLKFKSFRKKYMKLSKNTLVVEDDKESIYIVGSDQIWNPNNLSEDVRRVFYLDFVSDKKRKISYAASVGAQSLDKFDEQKYVEYLKKFNKISVREKSMSEHLSTKYDLETCTVLDPTLAVSKQFWYNIINNNINNNNKILVYTLGLNSNCDKYIDLFAKKLNKKITEIFYKKRFKNTTSIKNNCGPKEFIEEIAKSDIIITNSFHGMVFSIIFHKNFYVITRDDMNSRIYDLLDKLNLKNHIIKEENIKELLNLSIKNIDYDKIDAILEKERKKSEEFLKKALDIKN